MDNPFSGVTALPPSEQSSVRTSKKAPAPETARRDRYAHLTVLRRRRGLEAELLEFLPPASGQGQAQWARVQHETSTRQALRQGWRVSLPLQKTVRSRQLRLRKVDVIRNDGPFRISSQLENIARFGQGAGVDNVHWRDTRADDNASLGLCMARRAGIVRKDGAIDASSQPNGCSDPESHVVPRQRPNPRVLFSAVWTMTAPSCLGASWATC